MRFGERVALRDVSFEAARASWSRSSARTAPARRRCCRSSPASSAPAPDSVSRDPARIGWVPQQPALYSKLSVAENLRLFARLERVADPDAAVARMLEQTGLRERADEQLARLSGGNRQRVNIAIGLLARPAACSRSTSPPRRSTRASASACGVHPRSAPPKARASLFSTHDVGEVERHADARARARRRRAAVRRRPRGVPRRGGERERRRRLRGRVRVVPARRGGSDERRCCARTC